MPVLRVGPLNLPTWIIVSAGAVLVLVVARRLVASDDRVVWTRTDDLLTRAFGAGFLVWKLTPLATRFREIADTPLRLLYYPGGAAGIVAGGIAAAAVLIGAGFRARRREPFRRVHVVHALLLIAAVTLGPVSNAVVGAVSAGPSHAIWSPPPVFLRGMEVVSPDRPTVLVFWATWCGPCTAQMPELTRLYEQAGDRVNVLAVNMIRTESGVPAVEQYLEEAGLDFPVVLDTDGRLARSLGIASTPTTVVLDPAGVERFRRTGAISSVNLRRRVLPLAN